MPKPLPESLSRTSLALLLLAVWPAARAADVAECTISISGVEVELGRTSLGQCLRYARASLIGKDDVRNRELRHGDAHYRVSTAHAEISTDSGHSWQPMVADDLPASTAGLIALQADRDTVADVSPDTRRYLARLADRASAPAPSTPATSKSGPVVLATAPTQAPASAPAQPPAMVVAPTPVPVGNSAATLVPAVRKGESVEVAVVSRTPPPAPEVVAHAEPAAMVSSRGAAQFPCEYTLEGRWRSLLASSVDGCVEKVRSHLPPAAGNEVQAYWNGTYIAFSGGIAYVSDDGDHWQAAGSSGR